MKIKIGDRISTARARDLAQKLNLDDVVKNIDDNPDGFRDWTFDGFSCVPEKVVAKLLGISKKRMDHLVVTCALPHDLKYAYGRAEDYNARMMADLELGRNLIKNGVQSYVAEIVFVAVRVGGDELMKKSFSWGFARID